MCVSVSFVVYQTLAQNLGLETAVRILFHDLVGWLSGSSDLNQLTWAGWSRVTSHVQSLAWWQVRSRGEFGQEPLVIKQASPASFI